MHFKKLTEVETMFYIFKSIPAGLLDKE